MLKYCVEFKGNLSIYITFSRFGLR